MEAGSSKPDRADLGYTQSFFVGAGLLTFFLAPIALLIALVMLGGEKDPAKRATLKSWAWFSVIWTVLPTVVLVVLAY